MEPKVLPEKSDYHKHIESVIRTEFKDIKFINGKSFMVAAMDETDVIFVSSKGSKEDVTLALCELFHTISKLDRNYVCGKFAVMLDSENAALVYDTIRERDDFISFADDNDEKDED